LGHPVSPPSQSLANVLKQSDNHNGK